MTPKQREESDKRREAAQARMRQLLHEDQEFKRSTTDPEFTVEELANITGLAAPTIREHLAGAGVGFVALRPSSYGGRARKTRVVRWSQLRALATELGWF